MNNTEKTTRRVDPSFLDGKEPIAVGYKIFDWNWAGKNDYSYADKNGEVVGSIHTVTGELDPCGWGLHYCKNPLDCMKFKDLIQWNKFALVEAFDENIDIDGKNKSLCRTLKIVKELSFDDMISAIRASTGISYSNGISSSNGISCSKGVVDSLFCKNLHGAADCIFCESLKGAATMIFNKKVTKRRLREVGDKLLDFDWEPDFTNASELRGKAGGEWAKTPATQIRGRTEIEVYSEMPPEMLDYIKSLPEYDPEIFEAITGLAP